MDVFVLSLQAGMKSWNLVSLYYHIYLSMRRTIHGNSDRNIENYVVTMVFEMLNLNFQTTADIIHLEPFTCDLTVRRTNGSSFLLKPEQTMKT